MWSYVSPGYYITQKDLTTYKLQVDIFTSSNDGLKADLNHAVTELKETKILYRDYHFKWTQTNDALAKTTADYQEVLRNMISYDTMTKTREERIDKLKSELKKLQEDVDKLDNEHGSLKPLTVLVSAVRRHEEVRSVPKLTILWQWLNFENIKDTSSDLAGHESNSKIFFVNTCASSNIHENSCLFHLAEAVWPIKEIIGGNHLWQRADNEVSFSDRFIVLV